MAHDIDLGNAQQAGQRNHCLALFGISGQALTAQGIQQALGQWHHHMAPPTALGRMPEWQIARVIVRIEMIPAFWPKRFRSLPQRGIAMTQQWQHQHIVATADAAIKRRISGDALRRMFHDGGSKRSDS